MMNEEAEDADDDNESSTISSMPNTVLLVVDGTEEVESFTEFTGSPISYNNISSTNINEELQREYNLTFLNVKIDDEEWSWRLQDGGCALSELPKKTYNKPKIPRYGPTEAPRYYYDLTSIAIDYLKSFKSQHELG